MKKVILVGGIVLIVLFVSIIIYKLGYFYSFLPFPGSHNIISQTHNSITSNATIDHIAIITLENKPYGDIVQSQQAPYINSLIQKYSFADNYFAVSHPSLPNYLALVGGSTFGVTSDCTNCHVNARNIVDQVEQAHKTWKAYMESMPYPCFLGSSYPYAQKHNPFIYFVDIRNSPSRCNNIVPFNQLSADLQSVSRTPNFIWINPNLCHDMHDCSVEVGDMWLSEQVPVILQSPAFSHHKSLLVITWDEGSGNNKVPIILVGNAVKQAYISHSVYTHYSLLHTIENVWDLSALTANVSQSVVISDVMQ